MATWGESSRMMRVLAEEASAIGRLVASVRALAKDHSDCLTIQVPLNNACGELACVVQAFHEHAREFERMHFETEGEALPSVSSETGARERPNE
jgi:hypothetical protein